MMKFPDFAWRRTFLRRSFSQTLPVRPLLLVLLLLFWSGIALSQDSDGQETPAPEVSAVMENDASANDASLVDGAVDSAPGEGEVGETEPEAPLLPPDPVAWPSIDSLVEGLAFQGSRHETLLTIASLLELPRLQRSENDEEAQLRARQLLSNRDWLAQLETRYGYARARSPVLDPAAWQVQVQLDRIGLTNSLLASPLGPGTEVLAARVLNRDVPSLAAAALPELLWNLETEAPLIWQSLVRRLDDDPWLSAALMEQGGDYFAWPEAAATEQSEVAEATDAVEVLDADGAPISTLDLQLIEATNSLGVIFDQATAVGPPDPVRLHRLHRDLLGSMTDFDFGQRAQASILLHLATTVDGLQTQQYSRFTEGLLAVAAQLQDEVTWYPERMTALSAWLAEVIPPISASYGRQFAVVDPDLNSAIATSYDVIQALARGTTAEDRVELRQSLSNAVAKLSLLIPDLGYYFDQPIRDPIAGGVDACTGKAGQLEEDGSPSMTRDLFDDCQDTIVSLANFEARETQLAGSAEGPFGPAQLRRELRLTAGQRINYGIGYLHKTFGTKACSLPGRPLPNPLEWSYLATFMAWFAEQSPVYFQSPENEERLVRMQAIGNELVTVLAEQVDCFAGVGASVNDPVERVAAEYQAELLQLTRGMESAREAFRSNMLKPGADVRLEGGADQTTSYRTTGLEIGPCNVARACEMTENISPTRAMTGLFDQVFLIADQTGFGELEICYDDVGWVNRRSEPVRPGDENVANYFGQLSFELKGRFRQGDRSDDLFAFRFTDPEESHYLFSAMSDEVLEDACPSEWVGTRIVTPLPEGRPKIVPDRLTYLSAARTTPARLFELNWEGGNEWQDNFVLTRDYVEQLDVDAPPDISGALNQHLESLYREERSALYGILTPGREGANLAAELDALDSSKLLLKNQLMLFYSHVLIHTDPLREAITGQQGLLDRRQSFRSRQAERPMDDLLETAEDRIGAFREEWSTVPEVVRRKGSVADSVAHGMLRLEAVREQFFSAPDEVPTVTSAPLAGSISEPEEEEPAENEL